MKHISTTALSRKKDIPSKELFEQLTQLGYIFKVANRWTLTPLGIEKGGTYKETDKGDKYIVWPEDLELPEKPSEKSTQKASEAPKTAPKSQANHQMLITASKIGEHFDLPSNKVNFVLSELGWLKRGLKGWLVTDQGQKQGGIQAEFPQSGVPYGKWPQAILNIKALQESIAHVKGSEIVSPENYLTSKAAAFREKFPAKHRCTDGHMVRSKAEMLVDNYLYMAEIVHAYERKLPVEEDVYCDFYIPTGKVYIEYWGYEDDPKYLHRKKQKIEIYKKYNFNLIELQEKEVQNLDDILPRMLLKYGIQAY